jgi:uncharacterized protein (TIGR02453 family)
MAFRGWPAEALDFYEGLMADNSKTYWLAHKETYDGCVRTPMTELLTELEPEFGPAKIYRPYRDVRFSKDKTPYKTAIAASFERGGYVHLSVEGLAAGSGFYMFDSDRMRRFREAVANDESGRRLVAVIDAIRAKDIEVHSHEMLKRVPSGYPPDHPRAELLRYKDLVAWKHWPVGAWLGTAKAKTKLVDFFHDTTALNDWLAKQVG